MAFWKKRVYADAAAATPLSPIARTELIRLLGLYGNAGALHQEGVAAHAALETARTTIATAIGAHADEIIFTGNGTEGNNLAIQGSIRPLLSQHGEVHAITSVIEHQSVLEPLHALERDGLYTTLLGVDGEGLIDPQELAAAMNSETVCISIQLVNSEIGTVQPIKEIAKEVRRIRKQRNEEGNTLPLYFHCDASQAPLWIPLHMDALGVDFLTLDGQKVLGPKGVGALFVRRGCTLEPLLFGGSQERGLRGGTPNVPLAGSFALALKEAQAHATERSERVEKVRNQLFFDIQQYLPTAVLNGPQFAHRVANNLNISIPGLEGETGVIALDVEGIAASTRSACSVQEDTVSHVLAALRVPLEEARGAIRLTLLPDVTVADAHAIVHGLIRVAKRYKSVV